MRVDFEDHDRTWAVWVETGIRIHTLRLSYALRRPGSESVVSVAQLPIGDAVLDSFADSQEEPKALSEQLIDMLYTLASEKPPTECISYLQWRFCESIHDLRKRASAQSTNSAA
jgi:hypothetical protein